MCIIFTAGSLFSARDPLNRQPVNVNRESLKKIFYAAEKS